MNVSRLFPKQDSTISLAGNFAKAQANYKTMVINPGSEYKILENDICYYISVEKDENIKPIENYNCKNYATLFQKFSLRISLSRHSTSG
jgi:hypothetical protein